MLYLWHRKRPFCSACVGCVATKERHLSSPFCYLPIPLRVFWNLEAALQIPENSERGEQTTKRQSCSICVDAMGAYARQRGALCIRDATSIRLHLLYRGMVTAFSPCQVALSALPAPHLASPKVFWNLEAAVRKWLCHWLLYDSQYSPINISTRLQSEETPRTDKDVDGCERYPNMAIVAQPPKR